MNTLQLLTGTALIGFASFGASAAEPAGDPEPRGRSPFPIDIGQAETRAAERFTAIDTDGDGKVTPEEFAASPMMAPGEMAGGPGGKHRRGGMRGRQAKADGGDPDAAAAEDIIHPMHGTFEAHLADLDPDIFKRLDSNSDGKLAPEEFGVEKFHAAVQAAMRASMFARFDTNADGTLTREELPNPAQRLREMDADADGMVSRDEARAQRRTSEPKAN